MLARLAAMHAARAPRGHRPAPRSRADDRRGRGDPRSRRCARSASTSSRSPSTTSSDGAALASMAADRHWRGAMPARNTTSTRVLARDFWGLRSACGDTPARVQGRRARRPLSVPGIIGSGEAASYRRLPPPEPLHGPFKARTPARPDGANWKPPFRGASFLCQVALYAARITAGVVF